MKKLISVFSLVYCSLILTTSLFAIDGIFESVELIITDQTGCVATTYTFSQKVPGNNDYQINVGDNVSITFPVGTDASTFTNGTFNGVAIAGVTKTATQISFLAPAQVKKNNQFDIVLNGITNGGNLSENCSITTENNSSGVNSATYSFTTNACACVAISSFPWSENFDSETTPNLPSCWTMEDNNAPDDDWITSTSSSNSLPNCLKISYDGSNPLDDWVVSPEIILTGGVSYTIEFQYCAGMISFNESLELYYGSGQSSVSMLNQLYNDASFNHTDYQTVSVDFTPATTGSYYFGWHAYSVANQYSIHVDNVTLDLSPTCLTPTALAVSDITGEQASLSWTDNSGAALWDIELGVNGFSPSGTPTQSGVTNSYVYSGLEVLTDYQYYVRANCGGGDFSNWAGPCSFTTVCGVISPPWIEEFTDYLPNCWSEAEGVLASPATLSGTSSSWNYEMFANTGSNKSANLNIYGTDCENWLISPSIDLGAGAIDYQLEFDLALTDYGSTGAPETDGSDDKFAVLISLDDGVTWTSVNALQIWDNSTSPFVYNNISQTGEHIIINLSGYSGVVKFGFYGESASSNADNDLFVDNVEVIEIPSCPQPNSLSVSNIFPDEVNLNWVEFASATKWDIEYGATGFTQGSGTLISGILVNPYNLEGLTAATAYDFYVRADCGGGDYSDWTGPCTFNTADPYMTFVSSTVTQNNTGPASRGAVNQEIIGIEVVTAGPTNPLDITSFSFSTNGSTNPSTDVVSARIYSTGTSSAFSAATQFGLEFLAPNGNFAIDGTATLVDGTNYFWLVYDVNVGATVDNFLDAECTQITIDGINQIPTETNPAGNRQIKNIFLISDASDVSTCSGEFYDSGADIGNYSNSESYIKTFYSATPGSALQFVFSVFDTESYDDLFIYDGPDDTYPQIAGSPFNGTTSPGTIASAGESLTFKFESDGSNVKIGWEATISCIPITVPECAVLDAPVDGESDVCPGLVTLEWTTSASGFIAEGFKLFVGTSASANELIDGLDIGNVNSYDLVNLDGNTTFYWHVKPYNSAGIQSACGNNSFSTLDIGISNTNSPITTCLNSESLIATGNGVITWYDVPTGGVPVATGSPFVATFNGDATYYVAAESSGGGSEFGGRLTADGADGSFITDSEYGVIFNAAEDFEIVSTTIYPVGTGTVTIALLNDAGNEVAVTSAINVTGTGISTPVVVPLGFSVSAGNNYKIVIKDYSGITGLIRDFSASFPYSSPSGAISVTNGWTGSSSTSSYYWFYNIEISSSCVSARVPVYISHTADPVVITPDGPTTFLDGNSVTLSASSAASPEYTYTWSPATGLNTISGSVVLASPNVTTTYVVTGSNGSCSFSEEITITVTYPCAGLGTGHIPIANLPFNESSTTCGNVDDITSSNAIVCGSSYYYSGEDVVYSFTPTIEGLVTIDLLSSGSSTGIMLYDGCPMSGQGGTCVAYSQSTSGNETLCANLLQDVTYYLVVDSYDSPDCNPYTINISAPDAAGIDGDLPCGSIPIAIGGIQFGNNACASDVDEPSSPSCWSSGMMNTIWYSFDAPASGSVKIRTQLGSISSTQIAVYQGVCTNLTLLANACNQDASGTCSGTEDFSQLELTGLNAGETYYIRVDGEYDVTGSFEIQVIDGVNDWPAIPQQDCGSATLVCAPETVVGDPGFLGAGSTCDYSTPYGCFSSGTQNNTVWYQIDIDVDGMLTYSIIPNLSSTDYDWALIDVSGNASACDEISNGTLSPVRCNFTATSGATGLSASGTETSIGASGSTFCSQLPVTAGSQYLLLIWNWSGNNTGFTLDMNASPVVYDASTTLTWSGGASSDWFDPVNWGGCAIPSCGVDAIIVNGPTNQPRISAAGAECANITIENGASLTIDAGQSLAVCQNLNNSGAIHADPSSTILINHASNDHELNGSLTGENALGNLIVDKVAGSVSFLQDIEIAGNLSTSNATSVINTNGHNVIIGGDFEPFDGTYSNIGATGKLSFNGSALQAYNPGGSLLLNDVTLYNSGAGVVLNADMQLGVDGVLTLNQGLVETGVFKIVVNNTDPSAVSSGNTNSYINGTLRRYLALNTGAYLFPVGSSNAFRLAKVLNNNMNGPSYLDAEFMETFTNTGALDIAVAIDDGTPYQLVATEGIWRINPDAVITSGSYSIILYFDDGQGYDVSGNPIGNGFAGLIDNQFAVLKRPSGATSAASWIGQLAGSIPADNAPGRLIDDGFAKRMGLSSFSEFAIGKDNTVLPVELLEFSANCFMDKVELNWITATELNNDYFTLYRGIDGKQFEAFAKVDGQGNSLELNEYLYVDENPLENEMYYKLKQTDFDGKSSWSDVVFVSCVNDFGDFYISPNPFSNSVTVVFEEAVQTDCRIVLLDVMGKHILEKDVPVESVKITISDLIDLTPGAYYLKIESSDYVRTEKLVKM